MLKFLVDILQAALFFVVFIIACIIAGPVALVIWFFKRKEKYVYYFEGVLVAVIHPFFPSFGH